MTKKRILIVDDEKDFTDMITLNLQMTGLYEVMAENKGSRAYEAAKKFKPNLILLDVMMPDEDGGEVLFKINNDRELRDTPVVFLTAIVKKSEGAVGENLISGRPCLAKPIASNVLVEYIKKVIK